MRSSAQKPPRPEAPIAIHCRCGNRIVIEARWLGKPTACASCQADFVVSMLPEPKSGRSVPHVQYTPTILPDKVKKQGAGAATWANVTCECGTKIGLDARFIGKDMACSSCGRHFIVRMMPRARKEGETAVLTVTEKPPKPPTPQPGRSNAILDLARSAPPPKKHGPKPPDEMHLLCTCGEELVVPSDFYNRNMYCAGCGCLMHLRLEFDEGRTKYELLARVLDQPAEEGGGA